MTAVMMQQLQAFVKVAQSKGWNGQWQHISNHPRWRKLEKGLHNLRMTFICGLITILVLRGTMGAGKFGTPTEDLNLKTSRVYNTRTRQLQSLVEAVHDPSTPYSLGPPIKNWDQQRAGYATAVNGGHKQQAMKVMMVTGSRGDPCEHPIGDHLLLKALKNKIDYGRLKGIEVYFNMAPMDPTMSGSWAKLPLLRRLMLLRPDIEWFWWINSDAFISDLKFTIPLEKYSNYSLVVQGWPDLVFEQRDWLGLSTDSFLLRNNQWSLDLLDEWARMGPWGKLRDEAGQLLTQQLKGRPSMEADDQSALVWMLSEQRGKWASQSHLESSYHLHASWRRMVPRFGAMNNRSLTDSQRSPFVTGFTGCKPCDGFGKYDVELCIDGMNKAFNFGDNQLLRRYGFQHATIRSSSLKKSNITTRSSLAESRSTQVTQTIQSSMQR